MKRRSSLLLLSIIIGIGVILYIYRHDIIGHVFKVTISKKTNQTVDFKIGDVYYDVFRSNVTFSNSKMSFKNIFINKEKTIEFKEYDFNELSLRGLSVIDLIFRKEVKASKFIVNEPSFLFKENDKVKPFKEKPKDVIKNLKKHPEILGNLIINVKEIEITHGNIDLTSIIESEEHSGSVKFKLLLKDFNTSKEKLFDEDRFLFAKEHFFMLSDFSYLFPNGDQISFDSLVFGSVNNQLNITNLSATVIDTSKYSRVESIKANIAFFQLHGVDLDDIEQLHDVFIDSLVISDVFMDIIPNPNPYSKPKENHKNNLFNHISEIKLGKILLNNINAIVKAEQGDTILNMQKLKFSVGGIIIDSNIFINRRPEFDEKSLSLGLSHISLNDKELGVNASLENLLFDEEKQVVGFSSLSLDDKVDGEHSYIVLADSFELSGVSISSILNKTRMNIGLFISAPNININIEKALKKSKKNKNLEFNNIAINKINISDGNLHFVDLRTFNADFTGLNLNWDSINLINISKIHHLNTSYLNLSLSKFNYNSHSKSAIFNTDGIKLTNNEILVNNLNAKVKNAKVELNLRINQIFGNGTSFKNIIDNNEISFNQIKISKPNISSVIQSSQKTSNKTASSNLNYSIKIGDFEVLDGDLALEMESDTNRLTVKSEFSIITSEIDISDFKSTEWLHNLRWDINLLNTRLTNKDYLLTFDRILSDKQNNTLEIDNLRVLHSNESSALRRFNIIDVSLPSVQLEGVDYNSIVDNKTPIIKSAKIQDPLISLRIDARIQHNKQNSSKIPKKEEFPFDLDELVLNKLSVNIIKQDSVSTSYYKVNELDFSYKLDGSENIIDDINYLYISEIGFLDTIKNTFSQIGKVNFESNSVTVSDIRGGKIIKIDSQNYISYLSKEIKFSNMSVSNAIPSIVGIEGINIHNFDISIQDVKKESEGKTKTPKQIQLPEFLRSFEIDNLVADSINFTHILLSDSSVKKTALMNLGFEVDKLKIDSTVLNSHKYNYASKVSVDLSENKFVSKDSLYETSVQNISYSFPNSTLEVDSLTMMPRFNDKDFFKKAVYQTGRMKVVAGNILCSDFRLRSLIDDDKIHIGAIDVFGLEARIYRNKLYAMNPKEHKKMPQEAILNIPKVLLIDSLKTHSSYIQYKEFDKKSVIPGELFLDHFDLSIYNISNDLSIIDNTSAMTAKLEAKLLGQAALYLEATFPILSPSNDYWVRGNLKQIEFSELNNLTENIVGVTMADGSGTLDIPLISGNSKHSEGSIMFKYDKLKVELYDREKAEITKGLTGGMANLLLNDIFIKSNNPGFLGKDRPGEVYFVRNTQKSIVFNIWKSIMSGIMSTMGYNNKEQRQEKRDWKRKKKY